MEVLAENNSTISYRRRLKFIHYDSPAFRDQTNSVKRPLREQCNIRLAETTATKATTALVKRDRVWCTANDLVNICYAKIWRGTRISLEEEESEADMMENKPFPIYLEKNLDKLKKLRIKSRVKSRKCLDNKEVKEWIETPTKFIDILAKLREEKSDENRLEKSLENNKEFHGNERETKSENFIRNGLKKIQDVDKNRSENNKDFVDNQSEMKSEDFIKINIASLGKSSDFVQSKVNANPAVVKQTRSSHAVHFPQHILLCAALQEGDSCEVREVIQNNNIDLNSLSEATGYYYLHKTILNDQLRCAGVLIRNGINVNCVDNEGVSPLALAFRLINFPMVALLVHCGANVHQYTTARIQEMNKVKELSCSVSKVFEMDV